MANIKQFGGYTPDARRAADNEARKTRRDSIRLKPGRIVLRLLPRIAPAPPFVISHIHWVSTGPKKWATFACPRLMANKPCPECEFENKLSTGNEVDQDEAFRRQPQFTVFTNAILRGSGPEDEDAPLLVQEFQYGDGVRQKIDAVVADFGDPWDVQDGFDLSFTIPEGKNQRDCSVGAVGRGRATPLDPNGSWATQLKSFDKRVKLYSASEIVALMEGQPLPEHGNKRARAALGAGAAGRTVADDVDDGDDE